MKHPLKCIPILLATGFLSGAAALAGSFTTDFSSSSGFTLSGLAFLETNNCILTTATASQQGSVTLDDLDGGMAIESFTANFKLQLGPGSGNAADGVSFNFGPDIFPGLNIGEEGPGGSALSICFDPYDNGIAAEGVPTPSVDIRFRGAIVATHAYTKAEMVTSVPENVSVTLTRNGRVTVSYKGQVIHNNIFIPGWAPTYGYFNLSGRTGGEYEEQHISALSINTVLQGTAVAPTITANPQSVTVNEGNTTNFTVSVDGTAPFAFQWLKNNSPITDATNVTLTLGPIHFVDNNSKIKVTVTTDPAGSATSTEANITVIKDTTPPTVVKANADVTGTQVTVVFSEPMNDTVLDSSHYAINQGTTVFSVARLDASRVVLTTSAMPGGLSFTLTINGVQDTASSPPNPIATNTQVHFQTYLFQAGAVVHKKYTDPTPTDGTGFATLKTDPRYPNTPDRQDLMTSFEYPANGSGRDDNADPGGGGAVTYSDTLECYFIPATTGDYVFFASGADLNDVYLSSDSDPANMVNIAQCSGWTNPRDWNVSQCGTTNGLRSDWYLGNLWPGAGDPFSGQALIHLDVGVRYYMLAFHHRDTWSGGDEFAVTFKLAGQALPAGGEAPALTGGVIGTYLDPTGASVNFSQQPADANILQGRKATFSGLATGQSAYGTTVSYQWQTAPGGSSTFTNIPGATATSYTTPTLGVSDSGRKYQLLATVPGLTANSRVATVTVAADTIAPRLVGAGAVPSQAGTTFDVGVTFDEPVTQATAETLGNYTLSAGSISAVKFYAGSPGVVLTVSGLAVGNTYTVTVRNVADPYGNAMASSSLPFTVSRMQWGVVGGDELAFGNGVVAAGTNAFDIYSDGIGEWAAYDETTFVYEQITGNFDKEVRVEFQDASSQWARAGLIVRDVPNFGVNRAAQEGGQAGRYQKVHVNPVTTAMGTPGNNSWEGNRRLTTGGQTTTALTGVNSNPLYPNAWCRLQRIGQTFNIFRSDDGKNWVQLGSTTSADWGAATPMPDTLYVGMEYSPENGNVAAGLQGMFVARYRDYRTHTPVLTYVPTTGGMTITFEGTLQSAPTVNGPWTDMTGTGSPYPVVISPAPKFFRAKN